MIKQDLLHIFKRLDNLKMNNNADNSRPRNHFMKPYGNRFVSQKTQNARSYAKLSNATIRMLVEKEDLLQESYYNDGYVKMLQRENPRGTSLPPNFLVKSVHTVWFILYFRDGPIHPGKIVVDVETKQSYSLKIK